MIHKVSLGTVGLLLFVSILAAGCGEKVQMKQVDPVAGISKADQDKVREHLNAAGIKGEIESIADNDTQWVVQVGAPTPAPGKRAAPSMSTPYSVDKATGKVSGDQ